MRKKDAIVIHLSHSVSCERTIVSMMMTTTRLLRLLLAATASSLAVAAPRTLLSAPTMCNYNCAATPWLGCCEVNPAWQIQQKVRPVMPPDCACACGWAGGGDGSPQRQPGVAAIWGTEQSTLVQSVVERGARPLGYLAQYICL